MALRNLWERKLRTFLTSLAIVLGVMMVAGTYVLTDTINQSFDEIFTESNQGTDAVVSAKEIVETDDGTEPPISASLLPRIQRAPGVAIAAGGTIFSVIYFCSMWLAIASMIAMINVRQHFLSLPSLVRTVVAVALVLAAESRIRGWGAALAISVAVVHLRGPTRVRT